jgi:hypothetical protein
LPSSRKGRRIKLEVLRWRVNTAFNRSPGASAGNEKTSFVEIDDATGHVRPFFPLELAENLAPPA